MIPKIWDRIARLVTVPILEYLGLYCNLSVYHEIIVL